METINKIGTIIGSRDFLKKITAYILLIFLIIVFRGLLPIVAMTFIFGYLFYSLAFYLKKIFDKFVKNNTLQRIFGINTFIVLVYLGLVGFLILGSAKVFPNLVNELNTLAKQFPGLQEQFQEIQKAVLDLLNVTTIGDESVKNIITGPGGILDSENGYSSLLNGGLSELLSENVLSYIWGIFEQIKSFGGFVISLGTSLFLSFIILLDRKGLLGFLKKLETTNYSFLYDEFNGISKKIMNSVAPIIKGQTTIALANTTILLIGLFIIGLIFNPSEVGENGETIKGGFKFIWSLGLLFFFTSFIPFIGAFLSGIFIVGVALGFVGGFPAAIATLALIIGINMLESSVLNPKIMGGYFNFPMSLTFIIVLVGNYLFGIVGIILGLSLFAFTLSFFSDVDQIITDPKRGENDFKKRRI